MRITVPKLGSSKIHLLMKSTMTEASPDFNGIWNSIDSTNFEEFLQEIDVGISWRVLAAGSNPSIEIATNGDEWSLKTHTMLKTHEVKFKIGLEFLETRIDGVRVSSTIWEKITNICCNWPNGFQYSLSVCLFVLNVSLSLFLLLSSSLMSSCLFRYGQRACFSFR